ncbi:uncharacterized protein LOC120214569 [Hibiscus syriacus]|uniref:uncharacterized protein LOC120214569 n=1 Tax=Hibiscus syriacus TaxID=106335 RepID=UPI0019238AC5|nr:uncharacterized protein LOC120214569 [Hibiscus syriacus]
MVADAIIKMSEVTRYIGELAVEAKVIEHHINPVSKCGKKMLWMISEIVELNRRARPKVSKKMDDKLDRLEQEQKDMQAEMRSKFEKIEANIASSQLNMLQKLEDLFKKHAEKSHAGNPTSSNQDSIPPPGITTESGPPLGFTPIHISARSSIPQEARSHAYVSNENQQQQIGSTFPNSYQSVPGVRLGEFSTEHLIPDLNELAEKEKANEEITHQLKNLEERVKSVEVVESFYGFDARELNLVPDLIIPMKFKVPEFEKYDGTTCPSSHITMFCRRMAGHVQDEKLLIHCFQDSLKGSAAKWYNQLTRAHIKSWRDLAKRWRDVAAQVQPPLLEKEATVIFINTLKAPYLGHLLGNATKNFADLVISGELIENAIKSGKIEAVDGSSSKKLVYRKKENEVNNANVYNKNTSKSVTITQPMDERNDTSTARNDSKGPRKENERMSFTPLPVPYSEIYALLLKADVVRPYRLTPLQPPYPHWYDVNAHCDYHDGITGHSIENCLAFKKVVQNLINNGGLQFDSPDVSTHPLPNHGGKGVNAVHEENRKKTKTDVDEIKSPFIWVFQQLYHVGMVQQDPKPKPNECENYCEYHQEEGHKIQLCPKFRGLLQKLMDNKEIEFFEKDEEKRGEDVCTTENSKPMHKTNKHVVITVRPSAMNSTSVKPKVVITAPSPFPFKDTHKVPWNYTANVSMIRGSGSLEETKVAEENDKTPGSSLKNEIVSEVGHFTKSGRCYSPETSKEANKGKLKGKAAVVPQRIFNDEPLPLINESVTEAQAQEFLKFLKHSEYSVVEQLHKQQARISILDLLMNSEVHRNALLRVLNQTFVHEDITVNKLDRIVGHIAADNYITFTDGGMRSCTKMTVRETLEKRAKIGKGLDRCLQGTLHPKFVMIKSDRFGLGFEPDSQQRKKELKRRCEVRRARLKREDIPWDRMFFPPLKSSFKFGGVNDMEQ